MDLAALRHSLPHLSVVQRRMERWSNQLTYGEFGWVVDEDEVPCFASINVAGEKHAIAGKA